MFLSQNKVDDPLQMSTTVYPYKYSFLIYFLIKYIIELVVY